MLLDDLTLEVRDRTLKRVGQVTKPFLSMKATVRWCGVGEWELTLPGDHAMVDHLVADGSGVILLGPDGESTGVIFSGPTTTPKRKRDAQNPDGTFTFTGVTDEVHLLDALAYPNPLIADAQASSQSRANDTRTGLAEALLRQYVAYNIAGTHAPAGRLRGIRPSIKLFGGDLGRGISITKSPRFQNLLELLREIVTLEPSIGFRMVQIDGLIQFQVLDSRDKRAFVRFDVENGTLTSEEVQQSGPGLTTAIVAGQGEGTERTIITRTNADATAAEASWGRVIEAFVDQRDTDAVVELQQSGDEKLAEAAGGTSVKVIPADESTMQFGVDWRAGDQVTVVVNGVEAPTAVTETALLINSDGVRAGAALGDVSTFTKGDTLGAKVDALDVRVAQLERAGGLAERLSGKVVTDWNQALEAGFYWSEPNTANAPSTAAYVGEVRIAGGTFAGRIIQDLVVPSTTAMDFRRSWRRVRSETGVWSAWVPFSSPRHAEFSGSFALQNAGTGPTLIPALTRDTTYSRQGEFAAPVAGGVSVPAGLYQVTLALFIAVGTTTNLTRFFANVQDSITAPSGRFNRFINGANEDNFGGSATVYLPSAGTIQIALYQTSGTSRTVDLRLKITEME